MRDLAAAAEQIDYWVVGMSFNMRTVLISLKEP
jgi:hypothetical protein